MEEKEKMVDALQRMSEMTPLKIGTIVYWHNEGENYFHIKKGVVASFKEREIDKVIEYYIAPDEHAYWTSLSKRREEIYTQDELIHLLEKANEFFEKEMRKIESKWMDIIRRLLGASRSEA